MITNFETNKVLITKGLTYHHYVDATGHLLGCMYRHRIEWDFIPNTSSPLHIWARDYLPVQVSYDKFVRFCYTPDYLQDSPEYKPEVLSPHFDITELHYGAYTDKSWAYINFLHVGQHIFVPMLKDKLGGMAFKQISASYPQCDCHQIWGCDNIVREGGALNCCTRTRNYINPGIIY